jgi:hypothetical protein
MMAHWYSQFWDPACDLKNGRPWVQTSNPPSGVQVKLPASPLCQLRLKRPTAFEVESPVVLPKTKN